MKELIEKTVSQIKPLDRDIIERAGKRLDNLTKPKGSLGRLEELAKKVAGITEKKAPGLDKKIVFTFAGDHGVTQEGVSAYPKEVTAQMVFNFLRGGAAINVLARHIGAVVKVVDMGVGEDLEIKSENLQIRKIGYGTRNMAVEPAMTREEAEKSICAGIEVVESEKEVDIIGVGDMGIGNTTPSSAIVAAITGEPVAKVTGRGTGIDGAALNNKISVIEKALSVNSPDAGDPVDVLAKVGGFEIGGIAGCILGGAARRKPVVIDGFISTAGALIASELAPSVKQYLVASHLSVEIGHKIMLDKLGLKPLLELDLRLGEGTGAVLGMFMCEASIRILNEMATFEEASVSTEKG